MKARFGGDLDVIDLDLVSITTKRFADQNQQGLYQNEVTFNLTSTQRLGISAHNCKMAYCHFQSVSIFAILVPFLL